MGWVNVNRSIIIKPQWSPFQPYTWCQNNNSPIHPPTELENDITLMVGALGRDFIDDTRRAESPHSCNCLIRAESPLSCNCLIRAESPLSCNCLIRAESPLSCNCLIRDRHRVSLLISAPHDLIHSLMRFG